MPDMSGWTLLVTRLRTEQRAGQARARTIGRYQVLHNGVPATGPGMTGATIEREGPGDNGPIGKQERRCIEAGTYPVAMHDTENYSTTSFETDGDNPRPAIALRQTGDRTAILVHPANGYGSTIGCFNLGDRLDNANSDLDLMDSTRRVIAVIKDIKTFNGGTLPAGGTIPNCRIIVEDPPLDQIGSQPLREGSRGPLVHAWQMFLFRQGHSSNQPDGQFGSRTAAATGKFQQVNGLDVDGKVGRRTLDKARTLGFGGPEPSGVHHGMEAAPAEPMAGAFGFASEWAYLVGDLVGQDAPDEADSALARQARDLLRGKFPGRKLMLGFDVGMFLPPNSSENPAEKAAEKKAFKEFIAEIGQPTAIYLEGAFGATGTRWEKHEAERFIAAAIRHGLTTAAGAPRLIPLGSEHVKLTPALKTLVKSWDLSGKFWQETLDVLKQLKVVDGLTFDAVEIDNLGRAFDDSETEAFDRPGFAGFLGFLRTYADEFAHGSLPKLMLKNIETDVLEALESLVIAGDDPTKLPRAMFADFHIFEVEEGITEVRKKAKRKEIAEASARLGIQAVFSMETERYRTHGEFGAAAQQALTALMSAGPAAAIVGNAPHIAALAEAARRIEVSIGALIQLVQPGAAAAFAPHALAMAADPQLVAGAQAVSIGLTPEQRVICERIINVFETGSIRGDTSKISIFADGPHGIRQITYGRAQTTEYGNLAELVGMYIDAGGTFAAELRPFLPLISHTALVDNDDFKRLLKRAGREDPNMGRTQDVFFDKRYFQPAQKWAVENGFIKALSMLVIYDSFIHSGGILSFLRSRFPELPPVRGGNEQEWIRQYVDVRHEWLATHSNTILRNTIYRTRDFKREIGRQNWDLTILPISANGTPVTAAALGGMGIAEMAAWQPGDVPYLGPPSTTDAGSGAHELLDALEGFTADSDADDAIVRCEDHPVEDGFSAAASPEMPAELAARVLASTAITLSTGHVSGRVDDANARQNIVDTAAGNPARRSSYENAPGGTVHLDRRLLSGVLRIAEEHTFAINELCGGSHSPNSRHYAGIAFDVGIIDGQRVKLGHPSVRAFMGLCRSLGATEVLGPGNAGHAHHVHVAWPRV